MEVIAYFFESFFSPTPKSSFFLNLQEVAVTIVEDLGNSGSATFSLPIDATISRGNKVKIIENSGDVVFIGYVYDIEPILDRTRQIIQVTCKDEKHYLTNRHLLSPISFTNTPVVTIVQQIQNQYNSNGDARTVDVGYNTTTSLQASTGDNFFDVFSELAENLGGQFYIFDGKICIKPFVGLDRTSGPDYLEISTTPNEGVVSNIQITEEYSNINVLVAKEKGGATQVYPNPLPPVITGTAFKEFRPGNIQEKALQEIENLKKGIVRYEVSIENEGVNAYIGDKIRLRVDGLSNKYDFTGDIFVIKKTTSYENGTRKVSYGLSEVTTPRRTVASEINNIKRRVNLIST